ncbi:MAG: hypothetical protein OJI67_20110, partial [Prosthecobacter sp.]|nr:hypothetical protein [Prosthecobacter sp.]
SWKETRKRNSPGASASDICQRWVESYIEPKLKSQLIRSTIRLGETEWFLCSMELRSKGPNGTTGPEMQAEQQLNFAM